MYRIASATVPSFGLLCTMAVRCCAGLTALAQHWPVSDLTGDDTCSWMHSALHGRCKRFTVLQRKKLPLTHNMPLNRTSLVIISDSSSCSCTLRPVRPLPMGPSQQTRVRLQCMSGLGLPVSQKPATSLHLSVCLDCPEDPPHKDAGSNVSQCSLHDCQPQAQCQCIAKVECRLHHHRTMQVGLRSELFVLAPADMHAV